MLLERRHVDFAVAKRSDECCVGSSKHLMDRVPHYGNMVPKAFGAYENIARRSARSTGLQTSIVPSKTKSAGPVSVTFRNCSPCFSKPTFNSFPPRTSTPIGPSTFFSRGKNQRARHDAGPARERLVFHSALVGADRNLPGRRALQKIHVRALWAQKARGGGWPTRARAPPTFSRSSTGTHHVRHAAVHEMRGNLAARERDRNPEPQIFRLAHLQHAPARPAAPRRSRRPAFRTKAFLRARHVARRSGRNSARRCRTSPLRRHRRCNNASGNRRHSPARSRTSTPSAPTAAMSIADS